MDNESDFAEKKTEASYSHNALKGESEDSSCTLCGIPRKRHAIQERATDSEKVAMSTVTQQPVFIIEMDTRTCQATASRL